MNKNENIFASIDRIIEKINLLKREPEFSEEIKKRENSSYTLIENDNDVLKIFATLIAFSQNARANLVNEMIDNGTFDIIFKDYDIFEVSRMDPAEIKKLYWDKIGIIRFPSKINSIIECANSLLSIKLKYGSFLNLLNEAEIPIILKSESDIELFWKGFEILRKELKNENMPFFNQPTSLLHFLMYLGYDCIKPDTIVMQVCKNMRIVESEKGKKNLVETVKCIQKYSVNRNIKPSIVDFYLLIYGGQSWAKQFIKSG